jgi:two-component system, sensor histidine kinase PdtaS
MDIETVCTEPARTAHRDLAAENMRLRQMLEAAHVVAERYTTMLREGNHRIKNSLQVVSSLISLQAGHEENVSAREALRTAAARIQSVARMHDALQASGGDDSVNLGIVLEIMCGSLNDMGGDALNVKVSVDAQAIHAPIAFAQPISLAVNELVVNALRHAFPDGRTGSILVRLWSAEGQLRLLVSDDGVGFPTGQPEGRGYGMRLVRMMTEQIKGVLHVDSDAGTRITIVAPAPQAAASSVEPAFAPPKPTRLAAGSTKARSLLGVLSRKPWTATGRG